MNRIEAIFEGLRSDRKKALMPFVCGGSPTLEATERVLGRLGECGASIVEVGIPFSDPIADGPTIASAMHRALVEGVTPRGVLEAVARVRPKTELGLVAMVSVSIVGRMGAEKFAKDCAGAGFDGVIIPDVPVDEAGELTGVFGDAGLTMSLLVSPTTKAERVARIVKACTGFVYVLARVGITGESGGRGTEPAESGGLGARVELMRGMTDLPLACGFGIASAEQVRAVVHEAGADAAIVGSALVSRMLEAHDAGEDSVAAAAAFVGELSAGVYGAGVGA